MISGNKRRRIITGCQACRERHSRCDDDEPCRQCQLHNIECVRPINVRFRNSDTNTIGDFPTGQKWVSSSSNVEFHDETTEVAQYYGQADWNVNASVGTILSYSNLRERSDMSTPISITNSEQTSVNRSHAGLMPAPSPSKDTHYSQGSPPRSSPRHPDRDPSIDLRPSPRQPAPSPLVLESPSSINASSIDLDYRPRPLPPVVPFTDREAELVRNFSENMALWADITDIYRHFELEVPRRALFNLIIRYAVCAFSSRHMNRAQGDEGWTESLHYHNKCLEMLIPILSNLDHELTEDVLAAVAILRLDEEMEKQDNCFHLQGITRILNQVTTFCTSGGLGEATAWLCLRQEIYVSLVSQQPLRTQTTNFSRSTSLQRNDDTSWANRIVLLLAQVLSVAFQNPSPDNDTRLKQLDDRVEGWMREKPVTFDPIKYVPRDGKRLPAPLTSLSTSPSTSLTSPTTNQHQSTTTITTNNNDHHHPPHRFPIIWCLQPFHVLGLQYYHIAKIVLAVSASQSDPNKRYFYRWERPVERRVRSHILTIVGLAKSNPRAENTLFTARHTLTVWGNVLTKRGDQDGVKEFLREMEAKTGWETGKLIGTLEGQWDDSE